MVCLFQKGFLDASIEVVIGIIIARIVGDIVFFHLCEAETVIIWQLVRIHQFVNRWRGGFRVFADVKIIWIVDKQSIRKVWLKLESNDVI